MSIFALTILILLLLRAVVQFRLEQLNQRHARTHENAIPAAFRDTMDDATYRKSIAYTLAQSRFSQFEIGYDLAVLLLVLFSGWLPFSCHAFVATLGNSAGAMAAYLFAMGIVLSLAGLPLQWHHQFRLEARFGFNTTTPKLWWLDRLKGLVLAVLLGYPLLLLILKLVEWTGAYWWVWSWACLMLVQLVMSVLAPVLILPLFNKLTPLPEGSLRDRLLALGERTGFTARNILLMDGSKRSRHSNAFFTSLGRWRKIVLFDTLVQQLTEPELEAVLAHEIGHYKKGHIPKMLAFSALASLVGFYALAWLARQEWFYEWFGHNQPHVALALLLFGLVSGLVTFWFGPLSNFWSRRYEYQADAYAREAVGEAAPLVGALRRLSEKNLSNLTPHPLYSAFYYSHPTVIEREQALKL
ncbi:MAG: M48 family metallopeptidase [Verrucomicrobiota bacterium]